MATEDQDTKVTQRILAYLAGQKTLTLATATPAGIPHAATMEFVNDELKLYIWSGPGSTTVRNLEQNPAVAVTIGEYTDDWSKAKGVQAGGDCVRATEPDEIDRVARSFAEKFPKRTGYPVDDLLFFRITPVHVSFIDNESNAPTSSDAQPVGFDYKKTVAFSVFRNLPKSRAGVVAGQLESVHADADEVIVRQGSPAEAFFIVVDGEVEVARDDADEPVARLGAGQFFGEIAILRDTPRTATVRATKPTTLLKMDRDAFKALMAQSLSTTLDFDAVVRERLKALSQERTPNTAS